MVNIHKTRRKIKQTVAVRHVYGENFVVMIYSYQKRIKTKSDGMRKFVGRNMESKVYVAYSHVACLSTFVII